MTAQEDDYERKQKLPKAVRFLITFNHTIESEEF
jgi:hypothetical protein